MSSCTISISMRKNTEEKETIYRKFRRMNIEHQSSPRSNLHFVFQKYEAYFVV